MTGSYGGVCRTKRHPMTDENRLRSGGCRACARERQRRHRTGTIVSTEPHEQWVGTAYVLEHGLPGYPPPKYDEAKKLAWSAKCAAGARKRWAKHRAKQSEFSDL